MPKRSRHQKSTSGIKKPKKEAAPPQDPSAEEPAPISGFNLAGRPSRAQNSGGIYNIQHKTIKPIISGDLNTTPYWQFRVTSNNREWFRLSVDSISMILFGQYTNAAAATALDTATAETKAEKHALRAGKLKPLLFFDPSVLGTTFISSVDVNINNVPVPTNANLNNFLTAYTRFSNVFHHKSTEVFSSESDTALNTTTSQMTTAVYEGAKYLDYGFYNATDGRRVPIYLHGIFPFERTCRPRAALNKYSNDNLFFPPGTSIDIRVNLFPDKVNLLFNRHHLPLSTRYYSKTAAQALDDDVELTIQEVTLTYETYILDEKNHLSAMKEFHRGMTAKYDYDIVYPMHQSLASNQSYAHNEFQIPPYCSMICLMFLPDHALFYTPTQYKPISGFSKFPTHCINMRVKFNGTPLICDEFENIGILNHHNENSKRILYKYLVKNRLYSKSFETYFPTKAPLNQYFIKNMENMQSALTGSLTIETFYNSQKSPTNEQLLLFSIHAYGRGEVKLLNKIDYNYEWKFFNLTSSSNA